MTVILSHDVSTLNLHSLHGGTLNVNGVTPLAGRHPTGSPSPIQPLCPHAASTCKGLLAGIELVHDAVGEAAHVVGAGTCRHHRPTTTSRSNMVTSRCVRGAREHGRRLTQLKHTEPTPQSTRCCTIHGQRGDMPGSPFTVTARVFSGRTPCRHGEQAHTITHNRVSIGAGQRTTCTARHGTQ